MKRQVRVIYNDTEDRWFKSVEGTIIKFVGSERKAARYSMSTKDTQAIDYVLDRLKSAYPYDEFVVQTFTIEPEVWTLSVWSVK